MKKVKPSSVAAGVTAIVALVAIIGVVELFPHDSARTEKTHEKSTHSQPARSGSLAQRIGTPVRMISAVQAQQRREFSVMQRPPQKISRSTEAAIKSTLGEELLQRLGLNFTLGRRVVTPLGVVAWIIPGDHFMCIAQDRTGAIGCNTTQQTIEKGMTLEVGQPSRITPTGEVHLALGLAPDGIKVVNVHIGGRTRTMPVASNVYSVRAPRPITIELRHG